MKNLINYLFITIVVIGCQQPTSETSEEKEGVTPPANELIGTWGLDEWSYSGEDTSWHRTDLYGQAIFTESHYNVIFVNKDGLRENLLKDKSWDDFTVDDLRNTIGLVTSNAGRYNIEGDSLVYYRDVALYPSAMAAENQPVKMHLGKIENDIWVREGENWSIKWKRLE